MDDLTKERLAWIITDNADADDVPGLIDEIVSLVSAQRGIGDNLPPEPIDPEAKLRAINPEHILALPVADISPMLDLQYVPLVERSAELLARAEAWFKSHKHEATGRAVIASDVDTNAASDLYRQLKDHAGDNGEVEETRKKVKAEPYQATKIIDSWFANLRDRLTGAMKIIDASQNAYATAKAAREKLEREHVAEAARLEAKRIADEEQAKLDEAKRLADEAIERARLSGDDDAIDAAVEAEAKFVDQQIEAATAVNRAEDDAQIAVAQANASVADLTRTRSVLGTTTSTATSWGWELTSMIDLCRAVAEGRAPLDFVTTNGPVINAAVRGKNGRRECPGLTIKPNYAIRRTGA